MTENPPKFQFELSNLLRVANISNHECGIFFLSLFDEKEEITRRESFVKCFSSGPPDDCLLLNECPTIGEAGGLSHDFLFFISKEELGRKRNEDLKIGF